MRKALFAVFAVLALLLIYVAVCAFASRKALKNLNEYFPGFKAEKAYYFPLLDTYMVQGAAFYSLHIEKLTLTGLKRDDHAELAAKRIEIISLTDALSGLTVKKTALEGLRFIEDSFIFTYFTAEDIYYKNTRFSKLKVRMDFKDAFEKISTEGSGGFNGLYGAFKIELINNGELSKIDMKLAFDKFNLSATGYVSSNEELKKALLKLLSLHGRGLNTFAYAAVAGFDISYEDFGLWNFLEENAPETLREIDNATMRWSAEENGFSYGVDAAVLASVLKNKCIDGTDGLFFRASVNGGGEKKIPVPPCLTEPLGEAGEGFPYTIPPTEEETEEEWLAAPLYEE